ncbi:MAG: DUF86 domain-containing protein [Nitrospirota bacterium]|nr:DUF86 domain-containing protein [Nitrospirota bacterium]
MVDKALIGRKLERAESYLKQILTKKDPGITLFVKDSDLQSIILFNLIQAIQSCIDMGSHIISDSEWETPSTQAEIFEILASKKVITKAIAKKMIQMVGFRNRIVHEYEKTDMKIVHTVWKKHIADIESFCRAVVIKYNL